MSDETVAQPAAAQSQDASSNVAAEGTTSESVAPVSDAKSIEKKPASAADADTEEAAKDEETADSAPTTKTTDEKSTDPDVEMPDKPAEEADHPTADDKVDSEKAAEEPEAATGTADGTAAEVESTTQEKSKSRRKSTADSKSKKLNKKASKAKILHVDAQPGEHYFAKLKGFPPWPVIIAEEGMLPGTMLSSRPVTAARPDGTYREDFADGGKRIADRTFPVMYLHTNEFSWTTNSDLSELDPTTVASMITTKMRKDLQNAHLLAAEQNSLDYYKDVLHEFEEQRIAKLEAKMNKSNKTPKKASKAVEAAAGGEDEDVEMADVEEGDDVEPVEKKPKSKKRKAEDEASTPQRSESVKKPKIKITNSSTPKATNGVQSPTTKDSKAVKVKAKSGKGSKDKAESKKEKEPPKEPELSPEEKHMRKEKEILFLRHRLQKGLLLRDQEPKEEEMKSMSEFLAKLETFPDLEVSIIRATKINKVLKAILKLETIPKEDEFQFKPRSQSLLDKWNKLLATDGGAPAPANGVNGASAKSGKGAANGVKEASDPEKEDGKTDTVGDDTKEKAAADPASDEKADSAKDTKISADETVAEVEASA
ncbi:uncharacterized protein GGS22DRAFT_6907 [Annulohypoxylon maeteangense]|uniref:uncharacterized protein n=1 Tax=Annulohypoxylon maeteangense TaxID=1927788 RepID=UPI0020075DA2|nr:uncharacterized protein GGS22DRAFT_6907 [Annulohypoxylon maeteangense]KAI0889988.1 hypothetical protein GGS22DRAFT_6907 [Annulohypoxylon maeteangense]